MFKFIFPLLVALVFSINCAAQKNDKAAIQNCFDNYKKTILAEEGTEAVEYLSQRTVNYYADILKKSLGADSATVDKMNLMDKLMVFSLRHRAPKDSLLAFDGKSVIVYAIQKGMIGKSSVARNELGTIKIDKETAQAFIKSNGAETGMFFNFYKEKRNWKLDLTSFFPTANLVFQKLIRDDGRSENEYLFYLLEMITGEEVTENIWQPVVE